MFGHVDTCVLTLDSLTSYSLTPPIEQGTPILPFCVSFQNRTEDKPGWQTKCERNFRNGIAFDQSTLLCVASL